MKIAILNNATISADTLNRWFPDTEIEILRKRELVQLKKAKADILLIEDNLKLEKNGDNPYVLAITPSPPRTVLIGFLLKLRWKPSRIKSKIY